MAATYDPPTGTWIVRHPQRPDDIIARANTRAAAEAEAMARIDYERAVRA